jgi:hypothetical protein
MEKIKVAQVKNMLSPKSGNPVPNQFEIIGADGAEYFQSYRATIIKIHHGKTVLDKTYWDCSKTTRIYRNMFLGEDTQTIKRKIASKEYELVDLN